MQDPTPSQMQGEDTADLSQAQDHYPQSQAIKPEPSLQAKFHTAEEKIEEGRNKVAILIDKHIPQDITAFHEGQHEVLLNVMNTYQIPNLQSKNEEWTIPQLRSQEMKAKNKLVNELLPFAVGEDHMVQYKNLKKELKGATKPRPTFDTVDEYINARKNDTRNWGELYWFTTWREFLFFIYHTANHDQKRTTVVDVLQWERIYAPGLGTLEDIKDAFSGWYQKRAMKPESLPDNTQKWIAVTIQLMTHLWSDHIMVRRASSRVYSCARMNANRFGPAEITVASSLALIHKEYPGINHRSTFKPIFEFYRNLIDSFMFEVTNRSAFLQKRRWNRSKDNLANHRKIIGKVYKSHVFNANQVEMISQVETHNREQEFVDKVFTTIIQLKNDERIINLAKAKDWNGILEWLAHPEQAITEMKLGVKGANDELIKEVGKLLHGLRKTKFETQKLATNIMERVQDDTPSAPHFLQDSIACAELLPNSSLPDYVRDWEDIEPGRLREGMHNA